MTRRLLADLACGILDLVFAPACVACHGAISTAEEERLICRSCWSRARPIPAPRCDRCGNPVLPLLPGGADRCSLCPTLPPAVRAVRSAYVMDGPVREMVHALKYGGWTDTAIPLGRRMAAVPLPLEVVEEVRLVVPVPLGAVRLRQRGYNQAALLAREVALARGWEWRPEALLRSRSTGSQTTLHPSERRANVARAFSLHPEVEREVRREHVLLVDDVWTTGATALSCGEALLEGGARAVSVLTFARALPELQRVAESSPRTRTSS